MKKILLTLFIAIVLTGCPMDSQSDTRVVPSPTPIQLGLVECHQCCGDGLIDIEKESVHCPLCDGFGYVDEVEMGVFRDYSNEFKRGFRDFEEGKPYEEAPYLLKLRAKKWKAGWLEAEKHSKK